MLNDKKIEQIDNYTIDKVCKYADKNAVNGVKEFIERILNKERDDSGSDEAY